jgi:Peptidase family S41
MSEKMYAWLLRFCPPHFREKYGDEALQLLRDRARDETGFFRSVRLWLELLADFAISFPRVYRDARKALAGAVAQQRLDGVPSFYVLEDNSPRLGAFFFGGILSLAVLTTVSGLIIHVGGKRPVVNSTLRDFPPNIPRSSPSGSATPQPTEDSKQSSTEAAAQRENGSARLDAAERQRVIDRALENLKRYYFDRDVAQKTADALLVHEKNGDDNAATQGETFANLLTAQMRDASHDMHLSLEYSQNPWPEELPAETAESFERYRKAMLQQNCMIRKAEILPHNLGYLKLDFFPDSSVCASTAKTAMASLNQADAVIFDLRDSTGGFEDMVSLIASYLFDHPEYIYSPRAAPTENSWTRSPVPGNRLADKPAYVLISYTTWSGAEQFSYDLKMLKRATLVGETTRGGAHAGVFHRIDDHFGMGIPEEKAINPFGKADWEGVGVEPDVKVKAADALETAKKLAASKLQTN